MITWEYLWASGGEVDTNGLNYYGERGWELVSVVAHPDGSTAFFFKRPS